MLVLGGSFRRRGPRRAYRQKRGGKGLDIAQYAAGYGIALGLAGLFLTIFLERSLG